MASVKSKIEELVRRAERIGWTVNPGQGRNSAYAYAIYGDPCDSTDCPHIIYLHGTPSSTRWEKNVLTELDRHGFTDKEKWHDAAEELGRREKISTDKAKNQIALLKSDLEARNESLISKAAGTYLPQPVDVNWIFASHDFPETKRVLLTPDVAKVLIDSYNNANRPVRQNSLNFWIGQIRAGKYRYTHQGIAIDSSGTVQDGQHRLMAAIEEDYTLDIQVSVGMNPENFAVIDTNIPRSAGDAVYIAGLSANPKDTAATARLVIAYYRFGTNVRNLISKNKFSNEEIVNKVIEYGPKFAAAVDRGLKIARSSSTPPITRSAMCAGIYLITRDLPEGNSYVEDFLTLLTEGTNMEKGNPILTFRNSLYSMASSRANRTYVPSIDQLGMLLKAWNYWLLGKSISVFTFRSNELMPEVYLPEQRLL